MAAKQQPPRYGRNQTLFPSNVATYVPEDGLRAHGLLLRGVVTKVYEYDAPRRVATGLGASSAAIYCDVLVYSTRRSARGYFLPECLVSQDCANLHDGDIWKPRPTTMQFDRPLNPTKLYNLAELDGDHVVVGFLDGDFSYPIVLRQLPHPSTDLRRELPATIDAPGHRKKLRQTDGHVRLWRHHGTFFGVQPDGSFVVDASRGHHGRINADGTEQSYTEGNEAPPITLVRVRPGGKVRVEVVGNPENPDAIVTNDDPNPTPKALELEISENQVLVRLDGADNLTLTQSGANAELKVGDGSVHVAIGEHLQTLYNQLKTRLDAFDLAFANHLHGSSFGPTSPPEPGGSISAPAWDDVPTIISSKVSLPDE